MSRVISFCINYYLFYIYFYLSLCINYIGDQEDYVSDLNTCSRWNESSPAVEVVLEKILLAVPDGLCGEGQQPLSLWQL